MLAFIAGVYMLLLVRDPWGSQWVQGLPLLQVENPIVVEGTERHFWVQNYVIYAAWKSFYGSFGDTDLSRKWAACVLVHEATHIRLDTPNETAPRLAQYVCLDRMGAPQWMKDELYYSLMPFITNQITEYPEAEE